MTAGPLGTLIDYIKNQASAAGELMQGSKTYERYIPEISRINQTVNQLPQQQRAEFVKSSGVPDSVLKKYSTLKANEQKQGWMQPVGKAINAVNSGIANTPVVGDIAYRIPREYGMQAGRNIQEGASELLNQKDPYVDTRFSPTGKVYNPLPALKLMAGVGQLTPVGVGSSYMYEGGARGTETAFPKTKGTWVPGAVGLGASILGGAHLAKFLYGGPPGPKGKTDRLDESFTLPANDQGTGKGDLVFRVENPSQNGKAVLGDGKYFAFDKANTARYGTNAQEYWLDDKAKMLDLRDPNKLSEVTDKAVSTYKKEYAEALKKYGADDEGNKALGWVMRKFAESKGYDGILGDDKAFGSVVFNKDMLKPVKDAYQGLLQSAGKRQFGEAQLALENAINAGDRPGAMAALARIPDPATRDSFARLGFFNPKPLPGTNGTDVFGKEIPSYFGPSSFNGYGAKIPTTY